RLADAGAVGSALGRVARVARIVDADFARAARKAGDAAADLARLRLLAEARAVAAALGGVARVGRVVDAAVALRTGKPREAATDLAAADLFSLGRRGIILAVGRAPAGDDEREGGQSNGKKRMKFHGLGSILRRVSGERGGAWTTLSPSAGKAR